MAKPILTAARARELLHYDPETGLMTRKVALSNSVKVGDVFGCNVRGYLIGWCDRNMCSVHRLAFLIVTGEWPKFHVDHINGNRSDNRWCNLRDVHRNTNNENRRVANPSRRHDLPLGVTLDKRRGVYFARVSVGDKGKHLGSFKTPEEAHAAYIVGKRKYHSGCTL